MAEEKYICDSQQRLLKLVGTLVGSEINGQTAKELAGRMETSQATVFRDLQNLAAAGWAEQFEDGRWRLSVNAAKMLRRINDGINSALAKVNEARQKYQEVL